MDNQQQKQAPKTPAPVKREIMREYRALKDDMAEAAKAMQEARKSGGILGQKFMHTSTS